MSKAGAFLFAAFGTLLDREFVVGFPTPSRKLEFIKYLIGYGDENMNVIDRLGYDKVIEAAQNMGYDPGKPTELDEYISDISKMDLWDISKILFFGK
jgi:hypothetical protein